MRRVVTISPSTNYALASPLERSDQMESLARVLMGLSHPVQLVSAAREITAPFDWPRPPRLERSWSAVVDDDESGWRARTVASALDGVGLLSSQQPPQCGDLDRPSQVSREHVELDPSGEVAASLVLRRWPREVGPGWLGNALANDIPVDVGIHLQPQDSAWVARKLKLQQSRHQDSDDAGDLLSHRDARRVREDLIARKDRPVRVAIAFTVRAPSRDLLRQRVETLGYEMGLTLADVRQATFEQDRGLEATLPTGRCELLGAWHTLDCMSVASTWPFQPATVHHQHGAPLGTTQQGGMLVKLDPFDPSLESFGIIVLAKVGMGKSYFLKLLARRLAGVEVLIVEQRTPAEYATIPGAQAINLADVPPEQRAAHLRAFVSTLWETAKRDPRPRLLILDELWSLLRDPALAVLIEEIARIGRHHYLSLVIATQQVRELLESGRAVLDNAAVRVYLKQHDRDLDDLCNAVGLPAPARRFLRAAGRGQALLDVSGLLVPVDIQATQAEHRAITTDPREVRYGVGNLANHRADLAGVPADALAHQGVRDGLAGAVGAVNLE